VSQLAPAPRAAAALGEEDEPRSAPPCAPAIVIIGSPALIWRGIPNQGFEIRIRG
jgi:hypothetical protein